MTWWGDSTATIGHLIAIACCDFFSQEITSTGGAVRSRSMRWEYCYGAPCCDGVGSSWMGFGISDVKTVSESSSFELVVNFSPKGVLSHNLSSALPSLVDCVHEQSRPFGQSEKLTSGRRYLGLSMLSIGTFEVASHRSNTSPGGAEEQIAVAWHWPF